MKPPDLIRRRDDGAVVDSDSPTVAIARKDFAKRRWGQRWRRSRPFVLVLVISAVIATSGWLIYFSDVLIVKQVAVAGNSVLSSPRIESVAKVPRGVQLARIDLAAIQARVETIPAVASASVSRSWPHTVQIEVTERTPVAVVERGTGLQAVDADGVLFNRYPTRPKGLPLIRTSADIKAAALAEAARVVGALPPSVAAKVNYLDVASIDRIELLLHDGRKVLWGSADQSTTKAEVLVVLLRQKAQRIDVSVPSRPTTG